MNLANKIVLVTRPQHQALEFMQQIEQHGGKALSFPSIEIQQIDLDSSLASVLTNINSYDMLVFISANAVSHCVSLLQKLKISPQEITAKVAVIGKATGTAATAAGFVVSIQSDSGFNSDALLALPVLQGDQLQAKRILIVRGRGGLEQLTDTLTERGAEVSIAQVYVRKIPDYDVQLKRQQLSQNWTELGISDITVTSNESLQNLYEMLEVPARNEMLNTHLIVPSQRCAQLAKQLGFKTFSVAHSANNLHMLEAINNKI